VEGRDITQVPYVQHEIFISESFVFALDSLLSGARKAPSLIFMKSQCGTPAILRAFFDETFVIPTPVVASADGTSLGAQDMRQCYNECVAGFLFTKFDGTLITIRESPRGPRRAMSLSARTRGGVADSRP